MDEDEAKSIASDWIRQLEASLLAKVSDNHDTIPADHIYPSYHQEHFVSSSFSHDDLEKKHVDLQKTSSDEKIHQEATGLQNRKEISFQEVTISKTECPNDSIPKITADSSSNAPSSPRIDLEELRRKRLQRFENLINPKARDFKEKCLSLENTYFTESVSEENMLHCNANSLSKEEKTLRNSSEDKWKVKPCSYEAVRTISDEEDKLRLELWGLRGAVESGKLDIDSYLGPLFSRSKNSDAYNLENTFKEDQNSAHLKTFDNTSGTQHCSSSLDANFNFKKLDPNPDSVSKKCHKERKAIERNTSSVKSASSHRTVNNEIENTCQSGSISKEDFTRFSITKSKINPSCGSGTSSWQQIEGNLYNGFETSDSESCASGPCIHISHQSKSKTFQVKPDFTKPTDLQPLKSGKGKQKILNELTKFLVSEKDSTRDAKDFIRRSPKSSSESKCVESLVFSGEHMSDFQFLENLESSSLSNSDIRSCTTVTHKDCLSSNSNAREFNETYSLSNNRSLELSSILSQEKYKQSSDVQVEDSSSSSRTEMGKVCKGCLEVNSKAANWCIECGTALINVEPVPLSSEQLSKYEKQCQMTKSLIAETLESNKPSINGSPAMSKTEKDLVQDVLHLSKEVAKNDGFSNESLRSNLSNYKRRWLKSSIAWSSYEPLELSKPSSILKGNEKEMNKLKGNKNFQSQSSNDLSAEGLQKKHANKNGFSRSGGRHRTNNGNDHCADDHSKCALSINLEMPCSQEKVRPGSAKASGKSQRAKPHKKRPSSSKPINYFPSSSPDLLAITNGGKIGENLVHIPQLNLDDLGSYGRILTLIRSQRDCEPIPYLCLPEEIILQIFSYLSIKDKVSCARVCWQFYRIAMDETLWKTIIIRKNKHINDDWLESIGDRHPSSLTLSQCSGNNVTSNGLRSLFRKCAGSLKEINMSGCGGELIGESILLHISARCSAVVSVDVSWTNVSDNGVEALAENLTRLECLCLNGCQAITDKSLNCVANKHGESLRIFEVFGCFNITPASLQAFANKCIHLQTLNIGQCHKMTDSAIGNLVTHLCELENLDLRGCKQARDTAVKKIARHCPHLTSLVLANCPLITDVALSDISTNLPGIKSLDICGCANITDAGVRALARCCHKLELLDLSSTGNSVTSKSVVSLGNYCSQSLRVLKLSFCADITAHTVNQLAKNCKKLRLLHLYGCKRIREHDKLKNTNPLLVIEK